LQSYDSLASLHMDNLATKVGGKFRLTRLVSQRLRAINSGEPLLVDRQPNEALLAAVCREIEEDLISLDIPEVAVSAEETEFDILGIDESMA